MTVKKTTLIALAFALLVPVAALAQPGDTPGDGAPGRANLLRQLLPPAGYLQLTDAQKDELRDLAAGLRDALQPLREERQSLGAALRDELASDGPDATTVGQLTLDLRALGEETRDALAAFEEDFRTLLTPEQQTKWDNFLELRRLSRRERD